MGVSVLNRSVRLVFATLLLTQFLLPVQAEPPGKNWLSVGQTVQVDKLQASTPGGSIWASGTILEVNRSSNSYLVEVEGVKMTIINSDKWIKPAAAQDNAAGTQSANNAAAPASAPANGSTNFAGAVSGQHNVGAKPTAPAGTPEWERRKGLGTPPDGEYVVNKAGYGYGLDIGTLTIRGNTYRGIVRGEGASAPYTMDGDHIVWSNGLDGLPAGTKLVSSKYIGADERGRPLIRIYYRGTRGALEVLDAYRVSQ